jgi:hypothetical protein
MLANPDHILKVEAFGIGTFEMFRTFRKSTRTTAILRGRQAA